MKLLIAGGAGFVGINIVHYWHRKYPKDELVVVDRFTGPSEHIRQIWDQQERVNTIQMDIRNAKDFRGTVEALQPHVIINAIDSSRDPDYMETHLFTTTHILEAAKSVNVSRLLHLSCGEVYGMNDPLLSAQSSHRLLNESDALMPATPQQASKAAADMLVYSYHYSYGLPVTILRSAYLFGPYQAANRLIPLIITHALNNEPFTVYSSDTAERDLMYIDDLIVLIDKVLHAPQSNGALYNVSAGVQLRVMELASMILTFLDLPQSLIQPSNEKTMVSFGALDATKLKQTIDWEPTASHDIATRLQETVEWYRNNPVWWGGKIER